MQTGGTSSSGMKQKPLEHTVPEQLGPHWLSSRHGLRQTASTQVRSLGHCALEVHWGIGRTSGRHSPRSHRSALFEQSSS